MGQEVHNIWSSGKLWISSAGGAVYKISVWEKMFKVA